MRPIINALFVALLAGSLSAQPRTPLPRMPCMCAWKRMDCNVGMLGANQIIAHWTQRLGHWWLQNSTALTIPLMGLHIGGQLASPFRTARLSCPFQPHLPRQQSFPGNNPFFGRFSTSSPATIVTRHRVGFCLNQAQIRHSSPATIVPRQHGPYLSNLISRRTSL